MNWQEDLRFICTTLDANLRYAEGKHTSFIAFNGAAIFGGLTLLRNLNPQTSGILYGILLLTLLLLICAIISSIYSFFPKIIKQMESNAGESCGNVLFFEHVKYHSLESYAQLLCEKYHFNPDEILPLDECIISQIIVNARLASRKFALFKLVAFFDFTAVIMGLGGFVLATILKTLGVA